MRRREFIRCSGGAAAAWPVAARAQQSERMRRIGVLSSLAADDPQSQRRMTAFVQALQQHGWTEGRNVTIETRWGGGDSERLRRYAQELVALSPDVILAVTVSSTVPLQQATRTVPIVFVQVTDAVGAGFVESLSRPGGNATGFSLSEYGFSAKWLGLLKQIAPRITRAGVLRDPSNPSGIGLLAAIQGAAAALNVEVSPLGVRDVGEIERVIAAFAQRPNGGLVLVPTALTVINRQLIIDLAARHRLPAIYPYRYFAEAGGLMSYGTDEIRSISSGGRLCRSHPQRRKTGRPAGAAAKQIRIGDQPQDRQGAWPNSAADLTCPSRRGDRMKRREFIGGLVGAAAWPLAARAQQGERVRRVGILMNAVSEDSEGQSYVAGFQHGLQELGWSVGRNLRIELRWGGTNSDRWRRYAGELVGLSPDVIVAAGGVIVATLQRVSPRCRLCSRKRSISRAGVVTSLARPGGNATDLHSSSTA